MAASEVRERRAKTVRAKSRFACLSSTRNVVVFPLRGVKNDLASRSLKLVRAFD